MELVKLFPLFRGMFFASTGVLGIGGDGGDAGGGDAGAGGDEGGDIAVEETGDEGIGDVEGAESDTTEGDEGTGEADAEGGQKAKPDFKADLAKLKEVDPALADRYRKAMFKADDFTKVFPGGVVEARELKETLETYGGMEGIEANKSNAEEFAATLAKVAEGDPAVLDLVIQDSREGFLKLASAALVKAQGLDSKAFEKMMAGPLDQFLADKGFDSAIARVISYIQADKKDEALEYAAGLQNWRKSVSEFAKANHQEESKVDPNAAARQDIEKQKYEIFIGKASDAVTGESTRIMQRALAPFFKQNAKLTSVQRAGVMKEANETIMAELRRDKKYQTNMQALIKKQDIAGMKRYAASKWEALAGKHARTAWQSRGFGSSKPAPGAANGSVARSNGVVQVSKEPEAGDIDWTKDRSRMLYMSNKAYLKNGKLVTWKDDLS